MQYEETYESKVDLKTWKKLIKFVFSDKKAAPLIIYGIIMGLSDISMTLFSAYALDAYFEKGNYNSLPIFIVLLVFSAFLLGFSVWGFLVKAAEVEIETNYKLRREAFLNLQKLPISYYDKTPQGWIMARVTSDSRRLSEIISWGLIDILWSFVLMVTILVILFIFNVKLALIIFMSIPIMGVIAYYFRRMILKHYRESRKANSLVTGAYNEAFLGAKTTKSLAIEKSYQEEFEKLTFDLKSKTIKAVLWSAIFSPIILIISYLVLAFIMFEGSKVILNISVGVLSIGTFYLFVDYTIRFFDPIMQVARILAQLQQAQASLERIMSLIEEEPTIKDTEEVILKYGDLMHPKKENWEDFKGEIEFKNVSFHYKEEEPILTNFNLHIKKGTRLALVGPTGAGKTSIVNLIARFYEPISGEILVDGVNYKKRSLYWLHDKLGYVLQTPHLFTGTIFENIVYGKLDATLEEVINVSKIVGAHEFIMKMDKNYDSDIGEGGSKLSVGERQLISFARALIKNPEVLLLDEATSSIDSEKEKEIEKALKELLKDRTSIIVAHRLSTIVGSDIIIYLKNGEIVEMGNHKELIAKKGEYYNLYKKQFVLEYQQK